MAQFCSLSKDTIFQNQLNLDNNEFVSVDLLPEESVRSEIMATVQLFKNNSIVRIISFINYFRIITQTNYFVSAINTNLMVRIRGDWPNYIPVGRWMQFNKDHNNPTRFEKSCGNSNPNLPSGFFTLLNGIK